MIARSSEVSEALKENHFRIVDGVDSGEVSAFLISSNLQICEENDESPPDAFRRFMNIVFRNINHRNL
jgi:hypothetical protein